MRIFHLSDTHGLHNDLILPEADILIHSGDFTNHRDKFQNAGEFYLFIDWVEEVSKKFRHNVYIPGNHDTFVESSEKKTKQAFLDAGAALLINESIEIEGIKIWGSPLTPTFNDWAYNRDRGKIGKTWAKIPDNTQILVTHGPCKGILDLSENPWRELEQTGCSALASRIEDLKDLKFHLFGHIHDNPRYCKNQGVMIRNGVTYSNASCVTDNKFHLGPSSHGNLLEF